jgi:hypothetical protein
MKKSMDADLSSASAQSVPPTPGPWHCGKGDHWGREVRDSEGRGVAWCGQFPNELAHANARLVSAAPDLLALLIESQHSIGGDWRERRDAAIAKATGVEAAK